MDSGSSSRCTRRHHAVSCESGSSTVSSLRAAGAADVKVPLEGNRTWCGATRACRRRLATLGVRRESTSRARMWKSTTPRPSNSTASLQFIALARLDSQATFVRPRAMMCHAAALCRDVAAPTTTTSLPFSSLARLLRRPPLQAPLKPLRTALMSRFRLARRLRRVRLPVPSSCASLYTPSRKSRRSRSRPACAACVAPVSQRSPRSQPPASSLRGDASAESKHRRSSCGAPKAP
mmetsp:Transcript_8050/g.25908  ORF Transcript_8050/g.25908 Transcript_8050/m.25908 type:complete len:235 (+) Transcript_8050:3040-3744(+)|eukprot:scaffold26293_cov112-Isochrysis_galbana.AAC.5